MPTSLLPGGKFAIALTTQGNSTQAQAQADPPASPATAPAAATTSGVGPGGSGAGESRPEVPNLTLRRDSATGKGWIQTQNTTVLTETASEERIRPTLVLAAENAVNGMMNAIRATFKQPESTSTPTPTTRYSCRDV